MRFSGSTGGPVGEGDTELADEYAFFLWKAE